MTKLRWSAFFRLVFGVLFISVSMTACLFTDNTNNLNNCTTFTDSFSGEAASLIKESGSMASSYDRYWWLNSGAYLYRENGEASTVQKKLADKDSYRKLYEKSNPKDSDDGYCPQNLLRLVTRAKFKNFTQQVFFKIEQINISASPNRNQSNGVLLFHRYQDGDNLYYVGLRVDGYAVVKKKILGKYYTLKSVPVYPGQYSRDTLPNVLPLKQWLGIKTVISDNSQGNVDITLYLNDGQHYPDWKKILQVEDSGIDTAPIIDKGYAGIRSDFMDVHFAHYSAIESQTSTQKVCVAK
jgi:hypothetical protein